ncbi:SAM-dependent methyltransferase [Kibdelosporangium philippinense]|uniref:SAM-dependent methyltransferase n=1 Tax=Kibdelosporangium philippinense TaxID=211113 RepID=A0ABS8Z849_9PSEU|nr:SAM-dependent methyltransferase [Kibdelosporangium philippinense]MCE7002748.1 SAM-dependent methyltransferase [Kibdelosporangium philippinense]
METTRASVTRVHNAMLGGTDNFAADRAVRDHLLTIDPGFPNAARDARAFLFRTVRYLTSAGITQILDCGLRLPIRENSHTVAPGAEVVYASVDPIVLAHAREGMPANAHVTEANISRADRVLSDPTVRGHLDFSKPMGLLHVLTLHHVPDHDDPWLTMAQYIEALAPGSYVVLAHMRDPGPEHELAATIKRVGTAYREGIGTGWPRSTERILDLMPGLVLLGPGLVPVGNWRPDGPQTSNPGPMQRLFVGAVARKP